MKAGCFLVICLMCTLDVFAQNGKIKIDQSTVQSAEITDSGLINLLANDMMIPDANISRLVIYDLNGDGFGEGDLARTFPGGQVYLTTPSAEVQKAMNRWSFGDNVRFTAYANDSPDRFEHAPDSVRAMGGIFAALLRGIRRNYKGKHIKLYLEQNDFVSSIQMWSYDPRLMQYKPPPKDIVPEEVPVMKLIYLEKTVTDSIYTGPKYDLTRKR